MTDSIEPTEESPIKFPCEFIVKVMGEANDSFEQKVMQIFHRHFDEKEILKVTKRHSKEGNYLAITVVLFAQSREQLDSLYIELSDTPEVLMAL